MRSIQTKLALTLTSLSFAAVILSTWLLTAFDRYHFQQYVIQNQQLRNEKIVQVLSQAYEREGGWSNRTGIDIGEYCIREGMQIQVLDANKQLVWQFKNSNLKTDNLYPSTKQLSSDESLPINSKGKVVGYAKIAYVNPDSYTELDTHYWWGMRQGVISALVPVFLLSLAVSLVLSRRITKPLTEMTSLSRKMREGDLDVRVQSPQGQDEIAQLALSLNHLAESLQKQEKLRRNLTADVAHELRTPLATLKSHLEALIDGIWEPTQKRLKDCHEEVERLIALSSSLESLTRAESESLELVRRKEDLVEATSSVVQLMESSFLNKGVSLNFQGNGPLFAKIDRNKWKQVVMNLLSNALKYTDRGGNVTVRIEREEMKNGDRSKRKKENHSQNHALVTVSDTGRGIAAEHLPYIFERFYRVDPSRARATGGAGIGLAIVKQLVQAHGGTIDVTSEPSKGTDFFIRLPIV